MGAWDINDKTPGFGSTLDLLIIALCRDYERREEAILKRSCGPRVYMEYQYLNYRISEAARETAGIECGLTYINEVGKKIGYAGSKISCISESTYKREKLEVKLAIARKLALLD